MRIYKSQLYNPIEYNFQRSDKNTESISTGAQNENNSIKNNKKKNSASAITIASLAAIITLIMMSRGFQKNASKYMYQFREYLNKKHELSALNNSKKKTKFYEYAIDKINTFIKKSESINNITSLKDILVMKAMYKTEPTKKLHKGITDYFEKISRQKVLDSYKKTEKEFEIMNTAFDKLDEYIVKNSGDELVEYKGKPHTKKALVELAKSHRESANIVYKGFISESSLANRYEYINKVTSDLYSRFWDASFKDFWSKDNKFKRKEMWQTFIAAEQIDGHKTKLAEWVATARNALTYTNLDRSEQIHNYIKKLDGIILSSNKEGIMILARLKWFTKHPEALKYNPEAFYSELEKLSELKISGIDNNLVQTQEECKASYINIIKDLANKKATGEIQDMLSIYYKIAPFELDKTGASLAVKKAINSFDKSVELECVEFFDKVRDLRLGSAPTDVLTIVLSFLTLTFGLGYAKDKDARTSVMLKSGIPIVGGIATATYTALKLVSGGKSLALGFLSGIILNKLGVIADNIIKNRKLNDKQIN